MYEAKPKALISFTVTAKLICVFVFAYAKRWFSHKAAQMSLCICIGVRTHKKTKYDNFNLLWA